jgi:hypothetical protein
MQKLPYQCKHGLFFLSFIVSFRNAAVETFPNSVGSALRIREMNSRREHIRGID